MYKALAISLIIIENLSNELLIMKQLYNVTYICFVTKLAL